MKKLPMYSVSIPKNISWSWLTSYYNNELTVSLVEKNLEVWKNLQWDVMSLWSRAAIVFHNEYIHKYLMESWFNSISQCWSFIDNQWQSHQSLHLLELISQYYSYQSACDPNHMWRKNDIKRLWYLYKDKNMLPWKNAHPYLKWLLYFNQALSEELPEEYNIFRNSIHSIDSEEIIAEQIAEHANILFDTITPEQRERIEHKLMLKIDETLDLLEQNQQYVLEQK